MWKTALFAGLLVFFFACGDCGGPTSPEDAGPTTDAGPTDAGPHDGGPTTDAGPTDAGLTDAGPADAGPEDAGPDAGPVDGGPTDAGLDYAPEFTGTYVGTVIETRFAPDGGVSSTSAPSTVIVSYLATNRIRVLTPCGCLYPIVYCRFSAVTPDATSFTLELEQPYSCFVGTPSTRRTVTSGSGTKDGGVLTLDVDGHQTPISGNNLLYNFERDFSGALSDVDGGM